MNQIYAKNEYVVFPVKNGFIVYNTEKEFKSGHTHIRHFNSCIHLIQWAIQRKIPTRCSYYYLQSLIRVSDDLSYQQNIDALITVRKQKGKKLSYINKRAV